MGFIIFLCALLSFILLILVGICEYASDYHYFDDVLTAIIGLWLGFGVYWLIKLS